MAVTHTIKYFIFVSIQDFTKDTPISNFPKYMRNKQEAVFLFGNSNLLPASPVPKCSSLGFLLDWQTGSFPGFLPTSSFLYIPIHISKYRKTHMKPMAQPCILQPVLRKTLIPHGSFYSTLAKLFHSLCHLTRGYIIAPYLV